MKKTLLFVSLMFVMLWVHAESKFYIDDYKIKLGETKILEIKLLNEKICEGFQLKLSLPDGLSFAKDEEEDNYFAKANRTPNGFVLDCSLRPNGSLNLVGYCDGSANKVITPGDGTVFYVVVKADSEAALGEGSIKISNVEINLENEDNRHPADETFNAKIYAEYLVTAVSADEDMGSVTGGGYYEKGTIATLTAIPAEGYHFVKWSDENETVSREITVNAATTLTATFAPNQYTMTFVLDNGQENVVKRQDYATELTAPTGLTKTGFTFKGWDVQVPTNVPAEDKTFTAQWERNNYKLTWDVDGVKTVSDVAYEATITKPEDPEKEGYTFTGWAPEVAETMPAEDVTYTAQFTPIIIELDEKSETFTASGSAAIVKVKRTINANSWSTICLPFSMDENQVKTAFGNDVKLGDFKGYDLLDEGKTVQVKFDAATAIVANRPYIIKVSNPVEEFTVNGVAIIATEKPMTNYGSERQLKAMIGNYVNGTTLVEGDVFISGGKFWFSAGKTTIQGFRAFFSFYDLIPDFDGARFVLMFNDQPTGISMTRNQSDSKTIGYTIGGLQSNMDKKGLYIVNGKKIIKK